MAGLKVITPPAIEPVSLGAVLAQLRYDDDMVTPELEQELTDWIKAAREWCEGYQNRAYITQTLELALDYWPHHREIVLPRPPLQTVTSITYTDKSNSTTTWPTSEYIVDDYSFVARVVKVNSWPYVDLVVANGIKVRYAAGYGNADDVPQKIKQAITLLACYWFENGECDPPPAVLSLLSLDRVVPI